MKIRIKFSKQGAMKFVGHLDIMRYFQKAMRRAEVDICYSDGFSPHQIMSFAAPLGVGLTSQGEYLDIEVKSTDVSAIMVERLNATMAEGIRVLSFKQLPDTAKNAMSIVAAADYTLHFRKGCEPNDKDRFFADFNTFLASETIPYLKKTKKGEKEMDLKQLIYQERLEGDEFFLQLSTGSAANLKPEMVIDAFCLSQDIKLSPYAIQIQREEVYAESSENTFISLEQLGEEIE